jgi:hypothetical protein
MRIANGKSFCEKRLFFLRKQREKIGFLPQKPLTIEKIFGIMSPIGRHL